jgi:hypothetical protein|tara:strand:- start:6651 stop:7367 length:717 start_codon:yes stop_codon:yes gene_type:complete
MEIPTEKTKKASGLGDQVITIYGTPKIGKSTLASQFPNALFAATEPGLNFLEVYQVPIGDWTDFTNLCAIVASSPLQVETLVIDTVDILYLHCRDHVCNKAGIMHPSDASYGKGFAMVNGEFRRVLAKLGTLRTREGGKMGLVLVSHAKEIEHDTRVGKQLRWTPSLPGSARQIVEGMSDLLLFADVDSSDERVLRTKPSNRWVAGDRTGNLPETLPLSYEALSSAMNGGQQKETSDE